MTDMYIWYFNKLGFDPYEGLAVILNYKVLP